VARRRQRQPLSPGGIPDAVVLDSAALSAASEGHPRVRAELALAEQVGVAVHVSTVTLAETVRGHPRDARIHAILAGIEQDLVTTPLGRTAGELLGRTKRDDTIDAIIAVTAQNLGRRVRLVTGDPNDLNALTADMANVTVVPI
jgi:predicted nucleic acid-binding protein